MHRGAVERKEVRRATDTELFYRKSAENSESASESSKLHLQAVCSKCGHRHSLPILKHKHGVPPKPRQCTSCKRNLFMTKGVPETEFPRKSVKSSRGKFRFCTNLRRLNVTRGGSSNKVRASNVPVQQIEERQAEKEQAESRENRSESRATTMDQTTADVQGSSDRTHGLSTTETLNVEPTRRIRLRPLLRKLGKLLHIEKLRFSRRHQPAPRKTSLTDEDSTDKAVHEEANPNTSISDHASQHVEAAPQLARSDNLGLDSAASAHEMICDCTSQCPCRREAQHINQSEVSSIHSRQLFSNASATSLTTRHSSLVQRSTGLDLQGIGGHLYRVRAPDSGQASGSEDHQSSSARRQSGRFGSGETQASSTIPWRLQIPELTIEEVPGQEGNSPVVMNEGLTEEPKSL